MNSILGLIASYLVNAVWQVPLVVAAGWLASRMVKRLGPQAEHIAWVSTLVTANMTPAAPLFRWLTTLSYALHAPGARISIAFAAASDDLQALAGVYLLPAAVVWPILILYFGSLVYFAVRLAWSLQVTAKLLRKSTPLLLTAQQDELWRRCKEWFSLHTASIQSSAQVSGPVVLGFQVPVLLMPTDFAARCTPQDLHAALAHECAHIERRDFQKNLFYEAASLVLAFHPAIWFIKSQIAQTREMVCDAMATEMLVDSSSYARSLLRLAAIVAFSSPASSVHAIGIFDANILEKRIMTINIKKRLAGSALRYGLIVPAMLFLLSVAAGGAAMAVVIEPQSASKTPTQTSPQAPAQAGPYGEIYKIGKDVSAPVPLIMPPAKFSDEARKAKYQGVCIIGIIVDAQGNPQNVHVVRALGMGLDEKAMEAVRKYRFKPAQRLGKPVAVKINIEVNFHLYDKKGADGGGAAEPSAPPPPPPPPPPGA